MSPAKTALLLDFDGVVVRSPRVDRYVSAACTRLLADKARVKYRDAKRLNDVMYPKYGHTSTVIERVYGVPCGVREFNDAVYGKYVDYGQVARLLREPDLARARQFEALIRAWTPDRVFVFSNAAEGWVARVMELVGMQPLARGNILTSDKLRALKPHAGAYAEAEFHVRLACPDAEHVLFWDDQPKNIRALEEHREHLSLSWTGLFSEDDFGPHFEKRDALSLGRTASALSSAPSTHP